MGRAQKRAPDLRNLVNRSSNTLAYQTTTHGDHSIKGVRMSGWQSRTAREAKNRQQEFQAANLAQRVQTDHRLRHEATWEASSRYKAQAASAQRGQTQHDCSAEEALQQRRQCLAAKLAQETEQLRSLGSRRWHWRPPAGRICLTKREHGRAHAMRDVHRSALLRPRA